MRLLDVVAGAMRRMGAGAPLVEVFDAAECLRLQDFRRYIPGLRHVFHTPVVGIWRNAELAWSGEGYEAREEVARRFGYGSAEIVADVQNWIKAHRAREA
jgi:hypothetical protein